MLLPYCLRIRRNRATPLSRAQTGAAGSLPNTIEMAPFAAFCGTATIKDDAADTSLTKICGFQPTRLTPLNACRVEELPDREVVVRAKRVEHCEDLLLLHEPDRVVDRTAGVVPVVEIREIDLAAEYAALRVHVLEVRVGATRDVPGGSGLAAQRDARAEPDLVRIDAGRRRRTRTRRRGTDGRDCGGQEEDPHAHAVTDCTTDWVAAE